ncbi:hypothetical protein MCP1_240030 [Candidatus Terasakiella magnetica]|nr:hypothetical protein MCP1_240030 [Candidatus Terasakiella magnetica]
MDTMGYILLLAAALSLLPLSESFAETPKLVLNTIYSAPLRRLTRRVYWTSSTGSYLPGLGWISRFSSCPANGR